MLNQNKILDIDITYSKEIIENRATSKRSNSLAMYKKSQLRHLSQLESGYRLRMYFFQAEEKYKSNFGSEKHEKAFNCYEIYRTNEAEERNSFHSGWESDPIRHCVKVEV